MVFAALPRVLSIFAASRGVDVMPLLEPLGIDRATLEDRDARVPYRSLFVVWEELLRRFPDEPLGLEYARQITLEQLGVIGLFIMHSPTVRVALERSRKFQSLLDPKISYDMRPLDQERLLVTLAHEPRVVAMREPLEMMLGTMCLSVRRQLSPQDYRPIEVRIAHERRHDRALYEEVFGAPVVFDAPEYGVVIPTARLDAPLELATPEVSGYLEQQLRQYIGAPEDEGGGAEGWAEQVARHLREGLTDGEVDQHRVARELGLSTRSMQRHLRAEGTSFSAILEEVRRRRALELLRGTEYAVYEVAYALGYTEPSTFYRAFKRWTDDTPHQWRQRH